MGLTVVRGVRRNLDWVRWRYGGWDGQAEERWGAHEAVDAGTAEPGTRAERLGLMSLEVDQREEEQLEEEPEGAEGKLEAGLIGVSPSKA